MPRKLRKPQFQGGVALHRDSSAYGLRMSWYQRIRNRILGSSNTHQIFTLSILLVFVLGLSGCYPTPQPTPLVDSAETGTRSPPTLTPQPATMVEPRPSPPPTTPSPIPSPIPRPGLPPVEPSLITHGDRSRPYIALTFDACQTADHPAGYDAAIIKILTETETPATLFLGGLWMQSHPAQTQTLAANPLFELGNHSWSHADFTRLSPEEMSSEILRTQAKMYELTGRQPTLFRFPYDVGPDQALVMVGQYGLRAISGDVVSGDPDPRLSARAIVQAVTSQAENGSIIIMHMNTWGWHTAEALPAVIRQLRDKGYTFVTVSQLLGLGPP